MLVSQKKGLYDNDLECVNCYEQTGGDSAKVSHKCAFCYAHKKKCSLNPKPVWCFFVAITTNCQFVVIATNCLFVVSAQTGSCGNNSETPRMAKLQVPRYQVHWVL